MLVCIRYNVLIPKCADIFFIFHWVPLNPSVSSPWWSWCWLKLHQQWGDKAAPISMAHSFMGLDLHYHCANIWGHGSNLQWQNDIPSLGFGCPFYFSWTAQELYSNKKCKVSISVAVIVWWIMQLWKIVKVSLAPTYQPINTWRTGVGLWQMWSTYHAMKCLTNVLLVAGKLGCFSIILWDLEYAKEPFKSGFICEWN